MKTVADVMNPSLVYVQEGDRVEFAREHILAFGITAVPILDRNHRPVGVVSLRDLMNDARREDRVSAPPCTVLDSTSIEDAARALAATDLHHFVVVDKAGVAVGMVSAVDLLRAILGMPMHHPAAIEEIKGCAPAARTSPSSG